MYRFIYESYQQMYPFAEEKCRKKAGRAMLALPFPVGLALIFTWANPMSMLTLLLTLWLGIFLECELLSMLFSMEEERMYEEMNQLFSNIRHQYYCCGNVTDAVYFAAEGLEKGIQLHVQELYRVLVAKDRKLAEAAYKERVKNRFYRMLLLQAVAVEEHGDEEDEKGSVFLANLLGLRQEAERNKRKRKRMAYLCSGLGMVCAVPVFCMNWIREWAVGNLPELEMFYAGVAGKLVEGVAILLSVGAYFAVFRVRFPKERTKEEEILNFQFLIRLQKNLPGMTVIELLEVLEENAVIFKRALRDCILEVEQNEAAAFRRLREATKDAAFQKLADMFAMVEESSLAEAFEEIDAEMLEFEESRRLREEISQGRRAELAAIGACIPGSFLLAGYLIIPFMAECLRQLDSYMEGLAGAI